VRHGVTAAVTDNWERRNIRLVSSRLAQDSKGRLVVVVTSTCDTSLRVGEVFRVLGNDMPVNEVGYRWLGTKTGRRSDAHDRAPRRSSGARLPGAAKRER
jgi:hypothetical protein